MLDTLLFKEITTLPSLKPSPKTNEVFSNLVHFCLHAREEDLTLTPSSIKKLQQLSAKAETEMELYWAKKIINSKNPHEELRKFWYYQNYVHLVKLEHSHSIKYNYDIKKILFLGGGPLPLTAILLAENYGIQITVLEKNKYNYELSKKLISCLGLAHAVQIIHIDAIKYANYADFDCIYVASLVGLREQAKHKIITSVYAKASPGNLILCRSSYGARTFLYPRVPAITLECVSPFVEVRPNDSVINSLVILQKT